MHSTITIISIGLIMRGEASTPHTLLPNVSSSTAPPVNAPPSTGVFSDLRDLPLNIFLRLSLRLFMAAMAYINSPANTRATTANLPQVLICYGTFTFLKVALTSRQIVK